MRVGYEFVVCRGQKFIVFTVLGKTYAFGKMLYPHADGKIARLHNNSSFIEHSERIARGMAHASTAADTESSPSSPLSASRKITLLSSPPKCLNPTNFLLNRNLPAATLYVGADIFKHDFQFVAADVRFVEV